MRNLKLSVSERVLGQLARTRDFITQAAVGEQSIYGINTGFGFLSNVKIKKTELNELQENILRSHAAGVGEYLPREMVRSLIVLRMHSFALGHSGISVECFEMLQLLNADILRWFLGKKCGGVGRSCSIGPSRIASYW